MLFLYFMPVRVLCCSDDVLTFSYAYLFDAQSYCFCSTFQISHFGGCFQVLILVKTARQIIGLWKIVRIDFDAERPIYSGMQMFGKPLQNL